MEDFEVSCMFFRLVWISSQSGSPISIITYWPRFFYPKESFRLIYWTLMWWSARHLTFGPFYASVVYIYYYILLWVHFRNMTCIYDLDQWSLLIVNLLLFSLSVRFWRKLVILCKNYLSISFVLMIGCHILTEHCI